MVVRSAVVHTVWLGISTGIARLSSARPAYVLAALGLYVISVFITGARWRGFLRALGGDVSVFRAGLATLGGIAAGNVTPSRLGSEPCRVALVRLAGKATWPQVATAAAWDRLSEVPPIAVLGVMAAFALRDVNLSERTGLTSVAVLVALVAGTIGIRRLRRSTLSLAGWRERLALDRVGARVFATGVGYSTLVWLQDIVRLACAGRAIGVPLSPTQTAMLAVLTMLGGLVPTVGGLVVVESSLVAGLMAFGLDLPTAAAVTAVERAISYGFSTVAGGFVVALMGGRSLWSLAARPRGDSVPSDVPSAPPR